MSKVSTPGYYHKKTRSNHISSFNTILAQTNFNTTVSNRSEFPFPHISIQTHRGFNSPTQTPIKTDYNESVKPDTIELTSFYRTQTRNKHQRFSKEERQMFYTKYNIKTSPNTDYAFRDTKRPYDLSVSIPSSSVYFKNVSKAIETLRVNKQIVKQVHKLNSKYQIDSYCNNINSIEVYKNQLSKMPKVRIQKIQILDNGSNSMMRRASVIKKRAEIIPYLKISRDMFCTNDIKLNLSTITDIKPGPKPTSRSLFSLSLFGNEGFVFGGMNANYLSDMWLFKFSTHEWIKVSVNSKEEPVGRCNYSAVIINENIIIYGGCHPMNLIQPPEDILLFNLYTRKFSTPQLMNKKKLRLRKAHIGVAVGQTMLIHGGFDEENKMLNSAYIITMPKFSWSKLTIDEDSELPYLAYHSAQVISDYDKKAVEGERYNIYKPPAELIKNTSASVIKYRGIYIFGGLMRNDAMNSDLYVITIGKMPCDVFKLKTQGIGPSARINCGMIYINQLNSIIIHGGENRVKIFNDFFIFDIETLNWKTPVKASGLVTRTEHQMLFHEGRLLILGGRNEQLYHKMDFDSIEFTI